MPSFGQLASALGDHMYAGVVALVCINDETDLPDDLLFVDFGWFTDDDRLF